VECSDTKPKGIDWRAIFVWLSLALLFLQITDAAITQAALTTGWFVEGNRFIGVIAGKDWFPAAKGAITAILLGYVYWRIKRSDESGHARAFRMATIGVAILGLFYIGVVSWNLLVFRGVIC
jgi:hypothetical protein